MRKPQTLIIPPGDFAAYLFDCDGTIADSMPVHYLAWEKALSEWNCPFTETQFYAWAGRPIETIVKLLNEAHGLAMPAAEVAARRESHYYEYLPQIEAIPEVREQILAHHGRRPLAVVSGSPRVSVKKTLEVLELSRYFETLVCAEDYARGKPAPDAFLLAAKRLGVEASSCLVFEDADLGIAAAEAAGMAWVRVR